ncbi:MAG: metal ABC transporter substrate-binding protein [Akkermansiaceae bacterium]|jgi:manganese/iron transport system substrate-binding protein
MTKLIQKWCGIAAVLTVACGCGNNQKPADTGKLVVVTTFTIIADMAREVAGEAAVVESLIKPGAEIHGYEPTPKDIVRAQRAKLILSNGMNLEAWFAKFYQHLETVPNVVVTEGIRPIDISGGPYAGKPNPHAWMSPTLAMNYVDKISAALQTYDAANAEVYQKNAESYKAKIRTVDAKLRDTLSKIPVDKRCLVTSEGAFAYLCQDYGMQPVYLWPINADAQGTPQQVQSVIDRVRQQGVPVLFSESTVSDKPMRQVAQETGARYGGVLYVDSLTDADGPVPTYLRLLEHNANTIVGGFLGP